MKTTVDIADDLLRRAKEKAARDRTTLNALVEEGLGRILDVPATSKRPFRLRLHTVKGHGLQEGLSWDDWDGIMTLCYEGRGG